MTAIRRWFATGALISAGFLGGALLTGRLQSREAEDAQRPTTPAAASTAAAQPAGAVSATGLPDFTQIAARTSPSVVNISAVQVYRQRGSSTRSSATCSAARTRSPRSAARARAPA